MKRAKRKAAGNIAGGTILGKRAAELQERQARGEDVSADLAKLTSDFGKFCQRATQRQGEGG
jgi:hypothetical protein